MVVFGSKSSSGKTKLFEQPLDKLFNPKAIKHFNETIAASASRSPPALCQSLSAPLTSSTLTWAKLSRENSATKRKRAAARIRRFTIDANNNTASLITSTTSNIANHQTGNECNPNEEERCRLLLNVFPEPIRCLLNEIYLRGPSTVGIFRKSPNAKHCKELKQKLESPDFHLNEIEQYQVNVIASVFKEWLRSLPDCLLMSRLYPQWIDVAKLIEPLHLHYQQQQQMQRQQQQQSTDDTLDARLGITSSLEDNLNGNLTKSPNSSDGKTSLRPTKPAPSPMTDNGQQQSNNLSAVSDNKRQLSRALSCSIMTSDSGHSSTSSSPNSSSSSFDTCEVGAETRSGKHFQKATPEFQHQQQQQAAQAASYLKRKCYQQRQQSQTSIEFGSARSISQLIGLENRLSDTSNQSSQSNNLSMTEFSLKERRFECIRVVRQLLEALNETNLILLRAVICVLWHIADNDSYNKMSSSNLGVCIGQSLLNDEQQQHQLQNRGKKLQSFSLSTSSSSQLAQTNELKHVSPSSNFSKRHRRTRSQCLFTSTLSLTNLSHLSTNSSPTNSTGSNGHLASSISSNYLDSSGAQETAKYVPILVAFMIDHAKELFGSDVMNLFGPSRPRKQSDPDDNELVFNQSNSSECQQDVGNSQASLASHCVDSVVHGDGSPALPSTQPPVAVRTINQHVSPRADSHQSIDDHSLECKSIVVTREQSHSLDNRSGLFVKLDASDHPTSSQPVSSPWPVKQAVIVHVGSQPYTTSDHVTGTLCESATGRLLSTNNETTKLATNPATTTTSILIVNTQKKQTEQSVENGTAFELDRSRHYSISNDLQSKGKQTLDSTLCESINSDCDRVDSSPSLSLGVDIVDGAVNSKQDLMTTSTTASTVTTVAHQQQHQQQQQQRPLSATESTTSSSRASSSTSGVYSESPVFCEQDSASSASSQNCGTRTSITCSTSSRSASISSPTSTAPPACISNNSASSQLVNLNRMPKIPFQYTTSCYGGEAVLYYPSNAHLSQQQSMQQQQRAEQQQQQTMFHQRGGRFAPPTMQLRGCNRVQSLDRHTQVHHSSNHLHQQQPQRSHVMMLRDYYLSLQQQSQKQQQYWEFLKRQQQQRQQSLLTAEHSSDEEVCSSDESTGEWMESTMV